MTRQSAALSKQLLSTRLGLMGYYVEDLRNSFTVSVASDVDLVLGTTQYAINCTPDANGVVPLAQPGIYTIINTITASFQSGTTTLAMNRFVRLASVSAAITRDSAANVPQILTTTVNGSTQQAVTVSLSAADIALATDWTIRLHVKGTSGNIVAVINDATMSVIKNG